MNPKVTVDVPYHAALLCAASLMGMFSLSRRGCIVCVGQCLLFLF